MLVELRDRSIHIELVNMHDIAFTRSFLMHQPECFKCTAKYIFNSFIIVISSIPNKCYSHAKKLSHPGTLSNVYLISLCFTLACTGGITNMEK